MRANVANATRPSLTHKFTVGDVGGYITVVTEGKKVTDIFVEIDREGSTLGGWVRAWAVLASKALQSGVQLSEIISQFKGWEFGARGVTKTPDIPIAKSIPDYIVRWLEKRFGDKNGE